MNFLSSLPTIPSITTNKALLLLDFQNDFVRDSGALHVPNTADFLDTLPAAAAAFRRNGHVVWVRSHFESRRPLTDPDGQDLVVLDRPKKNRAPVPNSLPTGPVDDEAFLSADSPRCCRPHTPGAQFPAPILAAIKPDEDTLIDKSDYSALQDQSLILSFRTRFVTQLYLAGSLSNISVYATALDAVSLGFSVTLVEDCLGFRSFARHEDAMRRMADIFGASGITTDELHEELDWQETDALARKGGPRPVRTVKPAGIEGVMDGLGVEQDRPRRTLEEILADYDDDGELADLMARSSRPRRQTQPPTENRVRTKVQRPRRPDNRKHSRPEFCRPGDKIGEGDSRILYELDLPQDAFARIRDEVAWQKMYHLSGEVPRLVAAQGQPQPDGSVPIYRHPADESPPLRPFTATVDQVRVTVERILGHPLNHVLIQLYRDGEDRISEHSDKTLDVVRGSSICNVSLGCQRTMVLRSKTTHEGANGETGRITQRIPMPHESLFVLGEKTNMRWLHGIRADKRPLEAKSPDERAYDGQRISLTFRHIGTFTDPEGQAIWGQGATSKKQDDARKVLHGDPVQTDSLIKAFGNENHAIEFDWDAVYGEGFDAVNFVTKLTADLVLGSEPVDNLSVLVALGESGVRYRIVTDQSEKKKFLDLQDNDNDTGDTSEKQKFPAFRNSETKLPILRDNDNDKTITGAIAILSHLSQLPPRPGTNTIPGGSQLPQIEELLGAWRQCQASEFKSDFSELETWEDALEGRSYLSGTETGNGEFGLDDCALWPVLREIRMQSRFLAPKVYMNLAGYCERVQGRGVVRGILKDDEL